MDLNKTIRTDPEKSKMECLEIPVLGREHHSEYNLRDQLLNACKGVPQCNLACFVPATTFEGLCAQLRSSIATAIRNEEFLNQTNFSQQENNDQHYTDRRFHNGKFRGSPPSRYHDS
ncbi:integrase and RNaseH domain-containing protein, partial [Erysiphe neolycopersici]